MNLQNRIDLLADLGKYMKGSSEQWQSAIKLASAKNPWFTPEFCSIAIQNIADHYLQKDLLNSWCAQYAVPTETSDLKVGVVMAGNIPMVGMHDLISVFISGHQMHIKLSSKDDVLIRHICEWMYRQDESVASLIQISDQLKGCDAYICTGSAQSAALFRSYFGKYPHIIRPNKTSVAILTGQETETELKLLADDVHLYFGLGCRNVTKVYVPADYDFKPMLGAFEAYRMLMEQHRYKNNFDFQLSILLLNQQPYMSNEISLLVESPNLFSPIGVLHYEYYQDIHQLNAKLQIEVEIQCIVGASHTPFGTSQQPRLDDYADGIDTLKFLCQLADQINPSK